MEQLFDPIVIERWIAETGLWVETALLDWSLLVQAVAVLVAYIIARLTAPALRRFLAARTGKLPGARFIDPAIQTVQPLVMPVVWLVLQWFSVFLAQAVGWAHHLIESTVSLLTAWVVIRLLSGAIRDPGWSRSLAIIAWTVAALNLLGLLDPTMVALDSMAVGFGDIRISVLGLLKAGVVLAFLLWLAGVSTSLIERRLEHAGVLSPSARVLLGKTSRVLLIGVAVFAALNTIGIDLTALAVFSGAVGLGIGFGLQKVVSNLISGIILLLDKSVKPGDVIAIGDTFGWINSLSARYVSVITRDGTEHLIPNEELISQRVENWSYSNTLVRLRVPIGISYDCNPETAMELAVEAAKSVERVRPDPAPVCRLMNFGSDALELELRVWINDPQAGVANVNSDILVKVFHLFKEHGISFPYPQRDLHIRSSEPVPVTFSKPD